MMHSETAIVRKKVREVMAAVPLARPRSLPTNEALALLGDNRKPCLVLVDDEQKPVGIFTRADVLTRSAWRAPAGQAVSAVMTSPVVTVGIDDELFRAIAVLRRRQITRAPVVGADGRLRGMIELDTVLASLAGPTIALLERLGRDDSPDGLRAVKQAEIDLAAALLDDAVPGPDIQTLLTEINAELHRRALAHAVAGMEADGWGPPPVPFSLIVMGSHGRGENFLAPDQDNGFILADYDDALHGRMNDFFVPLAERFTALLDHIGFELCKGNVMATSPVWRKQLSEWIHQVEGWAERRTDQHLLLADILIDFRHVAGDVTLSARLREAMLAAFRRKPRFLRDLFSIEADHGVALGWFGRLSHERDDFDRPGFINLKLRGTLPLVEAARLMSLKAGLPKGTTLSRLDALLERGAIAAGEHDYLVSGYALMSRLLLREQISSLRAGNEINDFVAEASLSRREKEQLVACFKEIQTMRAALKLELSESAM